MKSELRNFCAVWIPRITAWDQEVCLKSPSPALEVALQDLRSCRTLEEAEMSVTWWRDGYEAVRIDPSPVTFQELAAFEVPPDDLVRRAHYRARGP